jgi:hypothetical protein
MAYEYISTFNLELRAYHLAQIELYPNLTKFNFNRTTCGESNDLPNAIQQQQILNKIEINNSHFLH